MKILKAVSIMMLLILTIPEAVSIISPFVDVSSELLICENSTEEEQKESNSEKDFDDLEEYLLLENGLYSEKYSLISLQYFYDNTIVNIVTDVVTPPPKQT